MKMNTRIWIYPLFLFILVILTSSCSKDGTSSKKNPIITWAVPENISFETLLSATQLNAAADVPGNFVYTPVIGTKLNVGANQDLKVDFTPTDAVTYNTVSKKVNITVTASITVTDINGNVYKTVKIGTQVWMKENLKTTKYRNGNIIGTTTPATLDISDQSTPKYQWSYDGNESNVVTYGRLYTWYTITDSRGVCPTGWHVPTDAEWTTLTNFLTNNGYGYQGSGSDIAKSMAVTSGWKISTTAGQVGYDQVSNNSSGFTAFPTGFYYYNGTFSYMGNAGFLWSSSEYDMSNAWGQSMNYGNENVSRINYGKASGLPVRCLKD